MRQPSTEVARYDGFCRKQWLGHSGNRLRCPRLPAATNRTSGYLSWRVLNVIRYNIGDREGSSFQAAYLADGRHEASSPNSAPTGTMAKSNFREIRIRSLRLPAPRLIQSCLL